MKLKVMTSVALFSTLLTFMPVNVAHAEDATDANDDDFASNITEEDGSNFEGINKQILQLTDKLGFSTNSFEDYPEERYEAYGNTAMGVLLSLKDSSYKDMTFSQAGTKQHEDFVANGGFVHSISTKNGTKEAGNTSYRAKNAGDFVDNYYMQLALAPVSNAEDFNKSIAQYAFYIATILKSYNMRPWLADASLEGFGTIISDTKAEEVYGDKANSDLKAYLLVNDYSIEELTDLVSYYYYNKIDDYEEMQPELKASNFTMEATSKAVTASELIEKANAKVSEYSGVENTQSLRITQASLANFNPAKAGKYTLTLTGSDLIGRKVTKDITVTVKSSGAVFYGSNNEVKVGTNVIDKDIFGLKVVDGVDGDVTDKFEAVAIDTSKEGTYTKTYSYTNSNGVTTSKEFTLTIKEDDAQTKSVPIHVKFIGTNKEGKEVQLYTLDESGNEIKNITLSGKVGEHYSYVAPEFDGWKLKGESLIEGEFSLDSTDLVFNYEMVNTLSTITFKYVDEDGKPLSIPVKTTDIDENGKPIEVVVNQSEFSITGDKGSSYLYEAPQLSGYKIKNEDVLNGKYVDDSKEVKIIYTKVEDETVPPESSEDSTESSESTTPSDSSSSSESSDSSSNSTEESTTDSSEAQTSDSSEPKDGEDGSKEDGKNDSKDDSKEDGSKDDSTKEDGSKEDGSTGDSKGDSKPKDSRTTGEASSDSEPTGNVIDDQVDVEEKTVTTNGKEDSDGNIKFISPETIKNTDKNAGSKDADGNVLPKTGTSFITVSPILLGLSTAMASLFLHKRKKEE